MSSSLVNDNNQEETRQPEDIRRSKSELAITDNEELICMLCGRPFQKRDHKGDMRHITHYDNYNHDEGYICLQCRGHWNQFKASKQQGIKLHETQVKNIRSAHNIRDSKGNKFEFQD